MVNRTLPAEWEWMTIGDVADTTSGGTPSRKYSEYFEGTIPWVKSGELGDGLVSVTEEKITETAIKNSSAKIFPAGSVLVALYGATVGKVGILNMDAASNQAVCALFPKNNSFTAKYMFYWLMSQRQDLINKSMGGAQPNISQGIVRAHPFPLSPISEQEWIVNRIEELLSDLDAGVAALERVRAGLKRYKASVLKAACEGRLFGDVELGDEGLPIGWQWIKIKEAGKVQLGRQRAPKHHQGTHMRPYLRVANVFEDRIDLSDVKEMNFTPDEYEIYKLEYGDILLNEGQSPEFLGRPAMYKGELPGGCFQNTLIRFQAFDFVDRHFALFVFRHYMHAGRFTQESQITTNMAHLSSGRFGSIEFPLPPLDEQRRIVAEVERRLSVVGEVESAVEVGLVRAGRLRQSVLRSAFEGKL